MTGMYEKKHLRFQIAQYGQDWFSLLQIYFISFMLKLKVTNLTKTMKVTETGPWNLKY